MRTPCPGWLRDCAWNVGKLRFYLGEFMTVKTNFAPLTSFAPSHLPLKWLLDPQKMLIPWPQKKPRSWIRINRAWCLGNMLKLKEYENCKQNHHDQKPKSVHKSKSTTNVWRCPSVAYTVHIYIYTYHLFPTNYTSQLGPIHGSIPNFPSPPRYSMAVTLQPCEDTPFVGLVGMDVGTGRTDDLSA